MKKILSAGDNFNAKTVFFSSLALIFFYLLFRNSGLYSGVQADEWSYSSFSRLIPLADSRIPSYLYLSVFQASNYCGDGFFACARALNSLFFIAAAPFIYLVASRFMSAKLAGFIALISVCSPLNVMTAYFMPEAMYMLAFWLVSWLAFRFFESPTALRGVVLGIAVGLASLVKMHALFLLPALALFMLYAAYAKGHAGAGGSRLRIALGRVFIMLVSVAVVRFGLGYLYAGINGLDLLGALYRAQTPKAAPTAASMQHLVELATGNAVGHALGLALLFGMPFAAAFAYPLGRAQAKDNVSALLMYSLLMLASLLAVTVIFTVVVAGGPYESTARLNMRYYDFIFPLFLMVAGAQLSKDALDSHLIGKLVSGAALAAAAVWAHYYLLKEFSPSFIDSPELSGLTSRLDLFNLLFGLALLCIAAWVANRKLGAALFLFGFVPLYTVLAGFAITSTIRQAMLPDVYERAGIFVHNILSKDESDHVAIIGENVPGLFKAKFYVDNPKVQFLPVPNGGSIDISALPANTHWLLAIGDYPRPANAVSQLDTGDFSLIRVVPPELAGKPVDTVQIHRSYGDVFDTDISQDKFSVESCKGSLDMINNLTPVPESVSASKLLEVGGWLATSGEKTTLPDAVYVVLTDEQGVHHYSKASRTSRPDVANYFHNPALNDSGFYDAIDLSDLKGKYLVGLAGTIGGQVKMCQQIKISLNVTN